MNARPYTRGCLALHIDDSQAGRWLAEVLTGVGLLAHAVDRCGDVPGRVVREMFVDAAMALGVGTQDSDSQADAALELFAAYLHGTIDLPDDSRAEAVVGWLRDTPVGVVAGHLARAAQEHMTRLIRLLVVAAGMWHGPVSS